MKTRTGHSFPFLHIFLGKYLSLKYIGKRRECFLFRRGSGLVPLVRMVKVLRTGDKEWWTKVDWELKWVVGKCELSPFDGSILPHPPELYSGAFPLELTFK